MLPTDDPFDSGVRVLLADADDGLRFFCDQRFGTDILMGTAVERWGAAVTRRPYALDPDLQD
jgi:hypothetical protein